MKQIFVLISEHCCPTHQVRGHSNIFTVLRGTRYRLGVWHTQQNIELKSYFKSNTLIFTFLILHFTFSPHRPGAWHTQQYFKINHHQKPYTNYLKSQNHQYQFHKILLMKSDN